MSTYQFTADDADIILLSTRCDVPRDFRVHKITLSLASPVFSGMFSIPQPHSRAPPTGSAVPVISVYETPEDLELLLRMIYPFGFPPTPDLSSISHALTILDKYEVQGAALQHLKLLLVSPEFLKNNPIQVYSIACGWKFKEEADIAAPYTSSVNLLSCIREEDVKRMTGMEYHRLLVLDEKRRSRSINCIRGARIFCYGCSRYKTFYAKYRGRLVDSFEKDHRPFYDHGRCTVLCFEIAMEVVGTEPLGCGMGRDSHLGSFIHTLAERLSVYPQTPNER